MQWEEFARACPEIAERAKSRFEGADHMVLVGTIRRDGSPRISPNEVEFVAGRLMLGMMWRSRKAMDIARDPRVVVHSVPKDRQGTGGDVKLYGTAVDERDLEIRKVYGDALEARIAWRPEEPNYHLFSLDIAEAAFIVFGDERSVLTWSPAAGLARSEAPS